MSTDAWEEIQAIKSKRNSLRERLEKRKKARQELLGSSLGSPSTVGIVDTSSTIFTSPTKVVIESEQKLDEKEDLLKFSPELERELLRQLSEVTLQLPIFSSELLTPFKLICSDRDNTHRKICNLLEKFAIQKLITLKPTSKDGVDVLEVTHIDVSKVNAIIIDGSEVKCDITKEDLKRKRDDSPEKNSELEEDKRKKEKKEPKADILSLLSMPSTKEKESKKLGEEILDLLSKPTAKERSLTERFKSQGGKQLMEFCPHGTRVDCERNGTVECKKLHFKKILQKHTDESLGDCSFLNTCFHMDTCKYVHYEVDRAGKSDDSPNILSGPVVRVESTTLYPPQWVQCDLRYLDMTVLGKFAVIMADPPWDIHMELPYGTMSDDEMRQLGIPQLQDEGLIFLWVTGRAMELGRECLQLWGYERVDEIIWVKTNQLQRIIRTGRTGHWLNHGKEHCLVGMKGNPPNLNRGLDSDVIVAEVRATSHKPDEIYGMIERLSPGTKKIELFGRPHNIQPNWITLGNQVDGIRLVDPVLIENFRKRYPTGNCMAPPPENTHV
ncbi:N6-adenosine-methyltransferase catalytic subunit isoform X1 [Diorhabda carinulata]|uniref:N6-adenosine-methyltransferase catalytic subunit isoform X1 n=2 Tax=Diorhabda carinulata TaxID=1163345 RepID=UPI0025A2A1E7|nr:N6-adenosine-methyltransferase catalytic subunit isoform X1 [Diorhabda carinulata]